MSKNTRKFAASTLAATTALAAVAPLAVSADTQIFTDVKAGSDEAVAINALANAGHITGYTLEDGTKEYRPAQKVSRSQAAALFTRILDLDVPADYVDVVNDAYSDVDGTHYNAKDIAATYNEGIFTGSAGKFNDGPLSRSQMATVIVRAFDLKDTGADVDVDLDSIEVTHRANVKILAQHGITKVTDFRPNETVSRGQFASFLYRAMQATEAPEVVGVSANNLKVVKVNFNQAVDADTITSSTVKVYEGTNTSATTVDATPEVVSAGEVGYVLSEDGKTLSIVFGTNLSQSDDLKVVVDGVKSTNGTEVTKAEKEVTVTDTTVPELLSAKSLNKKQVELQFSEPVNYSKAYYEVLNNVKVDGVAAIAKVTNNPAENKVILEFASNLKVGTLKFDVSDITDYAGYKAVAKSLNVEVAEDTAAPEIVKAEARNKNTVRVTFNEKVETLGSFEINDSTISGGSISPVAGSNGTQYDITYSLDLSAVVEVKVEYKGQKDVAENEVKDWKTFTFSVTDDTTMPTVAYGLGDANKLTLTFSKSMKINVGTIKVYDKDEKEVASLAVSGLTFKTDTNNTVLELTGSQLGLGDVNAGDYTVKIKDMKDASIRENLLPEQTFTIKAQDTKKPLVTSGYLVTNGSLTGSDTGKDDTIKIFFNEAMDADSLKNLSNYSVGGTALSTVSGAAVKSVAGDGKSVVLTYPLARALTTEQITLVALKDTSGNMINTTSISRLGATGVSVVGVTATAKNSITVEFNTAIQSVDPSSVKVQKTIDGGSTWTDEALPISASITGTSNNKVTYVLNKNLDTATANYRLVDNNSNLIKNIYGDTFKTTTGDLLGDTTDVAGTGPADGAITATDKVAISDKIAPELVSVRQNAANDGQIIVTLSETLGANATPENDLEFDLRVTDLTDEVELAPTEFTTTVTGSTVLIDVTKNGLANHKFSVELLNNRYLTDAATNKAVVFGATTVKNSAGTEVALITEREIPTTTITDAVYNATGNTITLTGTNFATLGATTADVKGQLDWSKLAISAVDGANPATAETIALADVASAVITNGTTLTITLNDAKASSLETAFGTLDATDTLEVTAGFTKDAAGNASTGDDLTANGLDS